jgi:hypothetical protein
MVETFPGDGCQRGVEATSPPMRRTLFQFAFLTLCALPCPILPAAAADAPAALVSTQELIFGNGTAGPFSLSWSAVRFGSERLSVNGTALHFGLDYQIDYAAGSITLTQPLRPNQIAQVDYAYDSSQAKLNHSPAQAPLSMRVWESGSGSLQMIGAIQPSAAPGGAPTASLLGFRGETALGGGQLSSLFLLAPGANPGNSSSAWQTAALRLGATRTTGPLKFTGSIGQAGSGFARANDYQLQSGLRVVDFSATFDPSRRLSFSSQVKRQDALDPADKAKQQESLTNQLTLAPNTGTKLTFSQESSSKARADGTAETLDSLRAQIEQKLGVGTTATAMTERRQTDAGGTIATTGVGLEAQAAPLLHLRTDFSHRDSSQDGRSDSMAFGLNAGREQHLALQGSFARTQAEKTGADTTSGLQLTMRPAQQVGFHIGMSQHLTDTQGSTTGAAWGVTAGRNGLLKVEGTTTSKVAVSGPGEQQEQLRIETTPLKGLKIATTSGTDQVGTDAARATRETSVEVSPLAALRVAGALRDEEAANGVTHIQSVSGSVKPAAFLDLSGAYKTREAPVGDPIITRNVRLALTPLRGLKLNGSYVENPEDKDGHVLPTTDTTLGLDSKIGCFSFGGSYTTGQGTDTVRLREQTELRLGLSLWGHSKLYSTYKSSDEQAAGLTQNRTLSLGFTRALTDNFYLLLEGQMTEVQVNGVSQPGMGDQRAQAKLGLRF